ncbi:MAG: heme-binding protein [Planctomycetota bacterium]
MTHGDLPGHAQVTDALRAVVAEANGGFGLQMWASVVDRSGNVVVVTRSGENPGDQWPGSRVISAQKANTANAFSLPGLALSTANLFTAVQPGNSLYGLQASNPVDTTVAYAGDFADFGTSHDPMLGHRIGGVNVFGGGLPLYNASGELIGALGVSGDSSVADHVIAWKLRDRLGLDHIPGGVSPTGDDNMVLDITAGTSASGWGHAATTPEATAIVNNLPQSHPIAR